MKLNNFFQACVYFTIIMLIFTLCVNFISVAGFFSIEATTDIDASTSDVNETFSTVTGGYTPSNIWEVWSLAGLVGLGGSIALAAITRSTTVIGIYLFSVVFWAAYLNLIGIISIGGYIPSEFLFIGSASIVFLWMGSIIGMLTGSG